MRRSPCNATFQAAELGAWELQPGFSGTDQPSEKIHHHQKADTQICQHICAAETDGSQHWIMIRFAIVILQSLASAF